MSLAPSLRAAHCTSVLETSSPIPLGIEHLGQCFLTARRLQNGEVEDRKRAQQSVTRPVPRLGDRNHAVVAEPTESLKSCEANVGRAIFE